MNNLPSQSFFNDNKLIIDDNLFFDKLFLFYLKLGILKQFSFVIDVPKILVQITDKNRLHNFVKNLTFVSVKFSQNLGYNHFKNFVHFGEFDFGIFECSKNEFLLVSGSGDKLSKAKISIIDKSLNDYKKIKKLQKNVVFSLKNTKKHKKIAIFNKNNQKISKLLHMHTNAYLIELKQKFSNL